MQSDTLSYFIGWMEKGIHKQNKVLAPKLPHITVLYTYIVIIYLFFTHSTTADFIVPLLSNIAQENLASLFAWSWIMLSHAEYCVMLSYAWQCCSSGVQFPGWKEIGSQKAKTLFLSLNSLNWKQRTEGRDDLTLPQNF